MANKVHLLIQNHLVFKLHCLRTAMLFSVMPLMATIEGGSRGRKEHALRTKNVPLELRELHKDGRMDETHTKKSTDK